MTVYSKRWVLISLALIAVLGFGSLLVVTVPYRNYLGDMLSAYTSMFNCRNLPAVNQVEGVLQGNAEVVQQIKFADT